MANPEIAPAPAGRNSRIVWALVATGLTAIPFLVVRFPPITDLPQHLAQVRLFGEALTDPQSPYVIQWLTPYGLSFAILGAAWLLCGAAAAPLAWLTPDRRGERHRFLFSLTSDCFGAATAALLVVFYLGLGLEALRSQPPALPGEPA